MSHLIEVIIANKELAGAVAALVLSELLPFVKGTKADGIVHGLILLLQKKEAPKDGAQ